MFVCGGLAGNVSQVSVQVLAFILLCCVCVRSGGCVRVGVWLVLASVAF